MIGILLSLILLMYLAYRGVSVIVLAPVLALLAAALSGQPLLATYTQIFMSALGGYIIKFFPLFLLGAIFGKLMEVTGSARAIAHAITAKIGTGQTAAAVVLACAALTYGGVSLFVVAFAVYPIAAALFVEANHPKRFIPATLALGSFTFTMTALPGTPAIQNAIPAPYFGTDAFAAPGLGLIAALIMGGGGMMWLRWRIAHAVSSGAGYGEVDEYSQRSTNPSKAEALPSPLQAFLPIMVVIGLNLLLTAMVLPALDTSYLSEDKFGAITLADVRGIWAIIAALLTAIVVLIATNWPRLREGLNEALTKGAQGSFLPVFNTASEVGYGSVIASLPAFAVIASGVTGVAPNNPLISEAIAVNALAGITGSASGGLSIALETMGGSFKQMAQTAGIDPALLHRVAAISAGGFDCLPHNGAVITLLAITGLNHRESYVDILLVAVLMPVLALISVIVLGTTFGSF